MSSRLDAVTEASSTNIGGFQPASRTEIHEFFTGLPDMIRGIGKDLASAAASMEDMHVHQAVIDMLRELGHVVEGTAQTAEDTFARHASEHSLWLND